MDALDRRGTEPESIPLTSLYDVLQVLPDRRLGQGKRYWLAHILCFVVLAKLAGEKTMSGVTQWIRHRGASLTQRFGLPREDMPSQTTYSNVLASVDGKRLDELLRVFFVRWEAACADVEPSLAACRLRKDKPIMPSSLSMAKPFGPPVRSRSLDAMHTQQTDVSPKYIGWKGMIS